MENFRGIRDCGHMDCGQGWLSSGSSDGSLVLSSGPPPQASVWQARDLAQPVWEPVTNGTPDGIVRIPMTNEAMFFKVERVPPPQP
jgi:hypothetical protein